ncbi:hypothetical protein [uncultured Bartonella sp.]|uniref:hypothetical protein n=1 Tax=uncultured Bartonella sp. TaxID=104108 RepID=UPI0025CE1DE9|nr:hypothetical protein [uncultured Bartonella sp.]
MPNIPLPFKGYTVVLKDDGYVIFLDDNEIIHERHDLDNYLEGGEAAENYINEELTKKYRFRLNKKGREHLNVFVDSCSKLSATEKETLYFYLVCRIEEVRKRVTFSQIVEMPVPPNLSKKNGGEVLKFCPKEFSHIRYSTVFWNGF